MGGCGSAPPSTQGGARCARLPWASLPCTFGAKYVGGPLTQGGARCARLPWASLPGTFGAKGPGPLRQQHSCALVCAGVSGYSPSPFSLKLGLWAKPTLRAQRLFCLADNFARGELCGQCVLTEPRKKKARAQMARAKQINLERLAAVQVVPLTPFTPDENRVAREQLAGHIRDLYEAGIRVFLPGAGTGEFHSLSVEEVLTTVRKLARRPAPMPWSWRRSGRAWARLWRWAGAQWKPGPRPF